MKTYRCERCGLKFKANARYMSETRRNYEYCVRCPRCGEKMIFKERKENEE